MTNTPQDDDIDAILDRQGGQYITYHNNYKKHQNFTRYQEDLRHASAEAKAALNQKIQAEIVAELKNICLNHWQLPIPEKAMLDRIKELTPTNDKEQV